LGQGANGPGNGVGVEYVAVGVSGGLGVVREGVLSLGAVERPEEPGEVGHPGEPVVLDRRKRGESFGREVEQAPKRAGCASA
jgi:hypothetical protein